MSSNDGFAGVSNCYVFKSRLQEYAQKVGLPTPVYETTKEGPPHVPSFKSTVIVNDVRYDSLPGFSNRKAAEQSAAEVALVELAKSGNMKECISQPVHETGLCKNLLQEYAQKMNYAIPMYVCQKDESPGRGAFFSCTVEIGGIRYIGAAARTKKEAEIKAARTALLAIQANTDGVGEKSIVNTQLTVVPGKRKGTESGNLDEPTKAPKPKKARYKTKAHRKKFPGNRVVDDQVEDASSTEVHINNQVGSELLQPDVSMVQLAEPAVLSMESKESAGEEKSIVNQNGGDNTDNQVGSELLQPDASMVQLAEPALLSKEPKESADEDKSIVNQNGGDHTDNQVRSELLQPDASMVQLTEPALLSMESKESTDEEKWIVNENGGDNTVAEGDPVPDNIGNCQNGQISSSDATKTDHRATELGIEISSKSSKEVVVNVTMEVNKASKAGLVDSAILNSSKEGHTEAVSAAEDFHQMDENEDDFKSNGASAMGIVASNLG